MLNVMQLAKTSNPTTLAITLSEAKKHLNVEVSETFYDEVITDLIYTAKDLVERRTHLVLFNTTFLAKWERFPEADDEHFVIPGYPIVSVESLQYYDTNGTLQTLTGFQESLSSKPAFLAPGVGLDWPDTQEHRIDAVQMAFTAGYGATVTTVPYQVKHLMKLLVAHWFKNREAVLSGTVSKEIELAFNALLNSVRVNEFQGFAKQ